MSDYEASPAEIDAALESWFPDAQMGWKGNPNFGKPCAPRWSQPTARASFFQPRDHVR
jgi:hypothetical protein